MDKNKKVLLWILYTVIIFGIFGFLIWMAQFQVFSQFITKIENSTFDLRQNIISGYKKPNKDIVILALDDESYEYIMDKAGTWPVTRRVWAGVIQALEIAKPKCIIFDMLFVKPNLLDVDSDNIFINEIARRGNIYLSMNFDNYDKTVRIPSVLDDKFKLNIKSGNLSDNEYVTFVNSRTIMRELLDVTKNVGIVNINRDKDGVVRNATPVFKYQGDYYPNLSLLVAMDLLGRNSLEIKNNKIILDEHHQIPLDDTQRAILNWYGEKQTFTHIPLWKVINAIQAADIQFLKENFQNKIVYIGTTTTSLYDIKSTPTESNLSGVELHTTFLNNILDNDFIKKSPLQVDFILSIILCLIVGYFVLKNPSVLKTFLILFAVLFSYSIFVLYAMMFCGIWMNLVLPYTATIITFILIYCEKYLLKVRDLEETYKLAVTDGLTQLYNHRYFQEQMIANLNNFSRHGSIFSMILIDIDFFKKFNDTYGHQSGDCILIQVANLIKKNVRGTDIACRYGGEEMSVILTNTSKKDAVITAEKICKAIRDCNFSLMDGKKASVTISVGVATVGEDGYTPQEIIEHADQCLYQAKEQGRDRVIY